MPRYTAVTRPTIQTSGGNTVSMLVGSSNGRGAVRSLFFSVEGAPADLNITWRLGRFTAGSSQSSGFTDLGYLDPADAGNNRITARQNATVEPTYASAHIWQGTLNTRMPYEKTWGPDEFRISTASGNGVGLLANATATGQICNVVWSWDE
jgi:hypothetical protein